MRTEPVLVKAGEHKIAATFVRRQEGPYEDLFRPHDWSFAGGGSGGPGITTLPHVKDFIVKGPYHPTGISETASRQKIFSCRPTVPSEERPCARQIIARIGAEAYLRPLTASEIDRLMPLYEQGARSEASALVRRSSSDAPSEGGKASAERSAGNFESGIREVLEAILASPHFIFRLEKEPDYA